MQKRTFKDYSLLFLKGMGMGGADVVPGVSGGTIAFITGIYEELLDSIKSIDKKAIGMLLKFDIKNLWHHINASFLLALFSGLLLSVVTFAKLIHHLLANHPIQIWSFFFGLIIISTVQVVKEIKQRTVPVFVAGLFGVVVAYFITDVSPATTPDTLPFVFVSAMIAICAMILPGISGSFILLILGKYQYIIGAVKDFNILILATFATGCVVGILSFSRVVSWLLKHFHDVTVAILAGFMVGSLNKIWPWKEVISTRINSKGEEVPFMERNLTPFDYETLLNKDSLVGHAILYFILGIMLVFAIEFVAKWMKKNQNS